MKKQITNLLSLAVIGLALVSCQKESDNTMVPNENGTHRQGSGAIINPVIGAPPSSFTQKALVESYVSANEGRTPMNDYMLNTVRGQYPNRIVAANFHSNDKMISSASDELLGFIGSQPSQIPATMQNRIPYNGNLFNTSMNWNNNLPATLSATATAGLAIQSSVNSTSNLTNVFLHAGFNTTLSGNYKLVAYLIENNVTGSGQGYDQANAGNNDPASPFYNMGNPIINYTHNYVVRQMLTSAEGVSIPSSYTVMGGHFRYRIAFDLPPLYNPSNCYVVAYIYNTSNMQILNVQTARLNTIQNWD
jgi:hypothetical protein